MHGTSSARTPPHAACWRSFCCTPVFIFWSITALRTGCTSTSGSFWVSQHGRRRTGIEIHPGATIGRCLFIDHGMGIVFGETCEIGDNCTIYHGVTLGGTGKDTGKRHPTIGNNVLISTGAKVLGPFTVGDNSRIGANAVVLQEVPPDSTVVGIKARVVKIAGQRIGPSPAYTLDQINLPDPLAQELCRLQSRVYANEQKLRKEEAREREADE